MKLQRGAVRKQERGDHRRDDLGRNHQERSSSLHREYDRYLKLSARVAEICRFEIVEGNAIRAQVTFHAKSPKSLEGKFRRFAATGKKDLAEVQAVFDEVRDLAAVRIAAYEQKHEDHVVQLVCKRFVDLRGATPAAELKDKDFAGMPSPMVLLACAGLLLAFKSYPKWKAEVSADAPLA